MGKFSIIWFGVSRILPVLNNEGDTRRSRGRSNRSTHSSDTLFQSEQPEAEGVLMSEAEQRY